MESNPRFRSRSPRVSGFLDNRKRRSQNGVLLIRDTFIVRSQKGNVAHIVLYFHPDNHRSVLAPHPTSNTNPCPSSPIAHNENSPALLSPKKSCFENYAKQIDIYLA
jgi:hypothetical protein